MKRIKHLEYLPIIIISIFIFFFINNYKSLLNIIKVVTPLLWGFAISYILNPLCKYIQKKTKWKWGASIFVVYLIVMIITAILVVILVPVLIDNLREFIKELPSIVRKANAGITAIINDLSKSSALKDVIERFNFNDLSSTITKFSTSFIANFSNIVVTFTSDLMRFIIGFVLSIYILLSKHKFIENAKKIISIYTYKNKNSRIYVVFKKADHYFGKFLAGKVLDSIIIGIIAFIGLSMLKAPFAPLNALVIGVTNIIPYFGPIIGGIPVVLITLVLHPIKAIWVALFIIVLQQVDGYFIGPKILGDTVGISPIWIIIGVLLGGGLFGVIGMILGVPFIALVNSEISYYIDESQKRIHDTNITS